MHRMRRWLLRAALVVALVFATVIGVRAFDARRLPELKVWHREAPRSEARAGEIDGMTLAQYLRREAAVMRETRAIEARTAPADRTPANRYFAGSFVNPGRFPRDWNLTFEVVPERVRGGALLIHGLSDSPYSLRPLAEVLRRHGFYALSLRMPGHGTTPAALTRADREDWLAAVRLGARHVRGRIENLMRMSCNPFFGYLEARVGEAIGANSGANFGANKEMSATPAPPSPSPAETRR